jgi:hypothetical protein
MKPPREREINNIMRIRNQQERVLTRREKRTSLRSNSTTVFNIR